ncbi:MAG: hypothetical protein SH857_00905 [Chitinophagales bacterium]|nr:hypothetical protein [Chitinophagales bacterium]
MIQKDRTRSRIAFIAMILFLCGNTFAQQVGINILNPDSSAILHVESKDKGFLWPRMTTAERDAIISPAIGLTIFNTEDSTIQYWNTICWLNVYQKDCADCYFDLTTNDIADTIDRTITDSTTFTITVDQNVGNPQNIAFTVLGTLPAGMTVDISPNPQFSSGTTTVTVRVTPYTPAGTYPVIIQTLCGSYFQNVIFSVTLTPCYLLNVDNSQNNYNGGVDLYATYPTAPTTTPVCVVITVDQGVDVTSVTSAAPAFTTGNLPAGSVVAIVNNGNIIGKGGDGGTANDPANGATGAGFNGGDAVNLTVNTNVQNNFNIYGGGGGGNSMAFALTYSFNVPIIGNITLGLLIGAGGGGGAGGSLGGNYPALIGLSFYQPGTGGTGGQYGVAGNGGFLIIPISTTQGPVTISINPNAFGGDGGEYGYPGTQGTFQVTISISVTVNIPFVGPITIPIVNNLNLPIPVPVPLPGNGGYAVKHNGFITNIPDNTYNTSFLKGRVGP